jgi:hypothetical protein
MNVWGCFVSGDGEDDVNNKASLLAWSWTWLFLALYPLII